MKCSGPHLSRPQKRDREAQKELQGLGWWGAGVGTGTGGRKIKEEGMQTLGPCII